MAPFPLPIASWGKIVEFAVYFLIGIGFGYTLEISGFGNSKKLAAQFYFKELTVLKVMFTAIVVAMVLIFAASAVGLLDYNLIWVNPTYLWPGIVGGLIMGVGFIVGGFCPGTSLVAAATLKLDGVFFALGGLFGMFLFGETVGFFDLFYNSSYMGRLTLPDWLGVPTGVVVLGVVLMALFMFWGGEHLERIFGGKDLSREPRLRYAGAGGLVLLAVAVLIIGQPTIADKWNRLAPTKEQALIDRTVHIHPGELLATMHDHKVKLTLLDVRDEADYNLFHIAETERVELEDLPDRVPEFLMSPPNTVFVVMSNDEGRATDAWKILTAESIPNVYILEGGINQWLALFGDQEIHLRASTVDSSVSLPPDSLRYEFSAALGDYCDEAVEPDPEEHHFDFVPKIVLKNKKSGGGGGCG